MISENSIDAISKIFCGDIPDLYQYKSGPQLVSFFNKHFGFADNYTYGGFQTRYKYVSQNLHILIEMARFENFFKLIVDVDFLMPELNIKLVDAVEHLKKIITAFNDILRTDNYKIIKNNKKIELIKIDDDEIYIGSGGFADVFELKSQGVVKKQLRYDSLSDYKILSRFKREYEITRSISDIPGIITVFEYDDDSCSYTMEKADMTLDQCMKIYPTLPEEKRFQCICKILEIMALVHKREIIHRDLSPTNIFIIKKEFKIADFGLGKDLQAAASHKTQSTQNYGQYEYCAPEQVRRLKDADKRSDVFSLGKIINFVMSDTHEAFDFNHSLRAVSSRATSEDPELRFKDSEELLHSVEKTKELIKRALSKEQFYEAISFDPQTLTSEMEAYIWELSGNSLCNELLQQNTNRALMAVLIRFMEISDQHGEFIICSVYNHYNEASGGIFKLYDPFAEFAALVIDNDFHFNINLLASKIIHYIAYTVGRYSAQHQVQVFMDQRPDLDPLIKDALSNG